MYRLQVTKFVDNPNYKEEMKEFKAISYGYSNNIQHPIAQAEERHLDITITDEEYEVIKKEVIKVS